MGDDFASGEKKQSGICPPAANDKSYFRVTRAPDAGSIRATLLSHTVLPEEEGKTVGALLRGRISTTLLRRLKEEPLGITLAGEHITVRGRVSAGQVLCLRAEESESSANIIPVKGEADIVFEDEYLMIINKPFGLAVHPSPGHFEDTLANRLAYIFARRGEPFVFRAVNRLDSGTGGLMCVAKDKHCAFIMDEAVARKDIRRVYEAVVCGVISEDGGVIDKPIGRMDGMGIKRCVRQDGERAVTHFRVLSRYPAHTLVEIELETGRTHQIRVHFADMGHPVWGDFMYGREESFRGHALFSKKIELSHPITGEKLCFEAKVPDFFSADFRG